MSRHFGITTVQAGLGGNERRPARHSANTRADLIPFPSNSLYAGRASLESSDVPQSFRDIGLVLLGSFTAVSLVVVFAIWFFIRS